MFLSTMALKVLLWLVLVFLGGGMAYGLKYNCSMSNGDNEKCIANSCIYDYKSELCFNPTDPSFKLLNICSESDGDPDDCIKQGCMACKCTEKCLPKSMAGECDQGCSAYCDEIDGCSRAGCVYDMLNGKCYSNDDKSMALVITCMVCKGNEFLCLQQGCHFCNCSKNCVPKALKRKCDLGCTKYCGLADECSSLPNCMYDYNKNECLEKYGITKGDICRESDGNIEDCTKKRCIVCPCTKECKEPSKAKEECDLGCNKMCNHETDCAPVGCTYDFATGQCGEGFGVSLFCGNICGEEYTDSNEAWYMPIGRNQIQVLQRRPQSECICGKDLPAVQASEIGPLIECGFASPEMEIDIPIREDSSFVIALYFAKLEEFDQNNFTVRLNSHVILDSFKSNTNMVLGVPETIKYEFRVKDDQTTLIIGDPPEKYPIINRWLKLNLKSVTQYDRAILNAFCIEYNLQGMPFEAEEQ